MVDVYGQRPGIPPKTIEEARNLEQRPLAVKGVTMGDAREFAQLLNAYYLAAIQRDAKTQRYLRATILASAVVAAGSMLFDSHLDLIKGAGLVGGMTFAAGQSIAWSERRKILDIGMQATACLYEAADNSGLTTSEVERLAKLYFRAQESQSYLIDGIERLRSDVDFHLAEGDAKIASGLSASEKKDMKKKREIVNFYMKSVEKLADAAMDDTSKEMAPYARRMKSIERNARVLVNRNLDVLRRINFELMKLEPDLATFTRNIRNTLSQGMSAVSGLPAGPLKVAETVEKPKDTATGGVIQGLVSKARELAIKGPETLKDALAKLDETLTLSESASLFQSATAARKEIEALKLSAQCLKTARDHFRRLTKSGLDIDLSVPQDFMESCTLALPNRSLRFEPASKTVSLDSKKTGQFKVIGGLAPHEAQPFDDGMIKITGKRILRGNVSVISFEALAPGETRIAVTDSTDLSADMAVMIKPKSGRKKVKKSCPEECPCVVDERKQNRDGKTKDQVKLLQSVLLSLKYLVNDKGEVLKDPVTAIDGDMGPVTRGGICRFQAANGLKPVNAKITPVVWKLISEKSKDGTVTDAYHPYEFSAKINKRTLRELKQSLEKVLAQQARIFEDEDLGKYAFDKKTREAIAKCRAKLKANTPLLGKAVDWRKPGPDGKKSKLKVELEGQLDARLHQEVLEAAEKIAALPENPENPGNPGN
jgi:peptidoglycan hydrolase-like protein with peptidoglycan-binding domain